MTPDQADRVLAHLAAAWPQVNLPGPTALAWYDHLRDIPAQAGEEAARRIVAEDERFPSMARFRAVAMDVRRRMEARAARDRGLPPPPLTDEERASRRELLRQIKTRHFGGADA